MTRRIPLMLLIAVIAVLGVLVYVQSNSVGMVKRGEGTIEKILGSGGSNAAYEAAITLQEGSGLDHESDHIFDAVSSLPGVKRAKLSDAGPAIRVEYDKDSVSEKEIADSLRKSGYVQ